MKRREGTGPVLYCGDPHGAFRQIVEAANDLRASAVVLLGDMEPSRPLEGELADIIDRVWRIPGNHDADDDASWQRTWGSGLAARNVHGQVVTLPDGTRLAGLGGVFREAVWHPDVGAPAYRSRAEHARATPRQDLWRDGHARRHWGTIYPDELDKLSDLRADVLVTHEAPGYHPHGFDILDTLAQSLGVKVTVHGHHHHRRDSSARWAAQRFRSYGVGLRGVTVIDQAGDATVVRPGDLDDARKGAVVTAGAVPADLPWCASALSGFQDKYSMTLDVSGVGAYAEVRHFLALCRRSREPSGRRSDAHACWTLGLIKWRNRRSARWVTPASAATGRR